MVKKSSAVFMSVLSLILLITGMLLSFYTMLPKENTEISDWYFWPNENTDGYELIFVCPITENPYWEQCVNGMYKADLELGTHTTVIGPKTADNFAVEIVDYIAEAVEKQPDGILAYSSIPAMQPYIEKASELGIPVISVDADATTDKRIAYVGTDLYSLGYKAGTEIMNIAASDAKIGYICSTFDANNEKTMLQAFSDAIYGSDMEIVVSMEGQNDPATAKKATEKCFQRIPKLQPYFVQVATMLREQDNIFWRTTLILL